MPRIAGRIKNMLNKQVLCKLTTPERDALEKYAYERGVTMSSAVRDAIRVVIIEGVVGGERTLELRERQGD